MGYNLEYIKLRSVDSPVAAGRIVLHPIVQKPERIPETIGLLHLEIV